MSKDMTWEEYADELKAELAKVKQQLAIAEKYLDEISDAVEIYLSKENRTEEFTKDCLLGCGLSANQAKWEIKELDK